MQLYRDSIEASKDHPSTLMVRRALSFTAPWTTALSSSMVNGASASPRTQGRQREKEFNTDDAHGLFMDNDQHAPRRLTRQQSTTHSRWRRPSFSGKRKDSKDEANNAATAAAQPISTSNSNTTTASTSTNTTGQKKETPALAPAADPRVEIKKLLRDRDDDTGTTSDKDSECSRPMKALEEQNARRQLRAASATDLHVSSSLVPGELPVQPLTDIPNAAQFRAKYTLYNPVGPRWYKNEHLIPPSTRIPLSSTFSPNFPPTKTAIGADAAAAAADPGRMPGLSRTPSGSPIPTPSGSQTRLGDNFPPQRTRKISNTAHDNVDMLDASDPYGANWHHASPYEVVGLNGPAPQEQPQGRANGSRTSSTTRQNVRLPNPSPLSQSTSAVHLAEPPHATVPPRKRTLSKPTTAGIRRFFSSSTDDITRKDGKSVSAPVTPVEGEAADTGTIPRKLSKRGKTVPVMDAVSSMLTVQTGVDRKEKRSSIMGRIGKKFSVLRKPLHEHHSLMEQRNDNVERGRQRRPSLSSSIRQGTVSVSEPRKLSKRIPPPEPKEEMAHRTSASIDIEFPISMGNLMITNPDQPSSGANSPRRANGFTPSPDSTVAPLPPPKHPLPHPPDSESDDDDGPPQQSVLRIRNTPDHTPDHTPEYETEGLPLPQSAQPPQSNNLPSPPSPEPPLSPLLPPPPLRHSSLPPIFSPTAISVSLSTADFSSPPPLPEKNLVYSGSMSDSPTTGEMDMDLMPDIATEPDYERRAETPTQVPPLPGPVPRTQQQSGLRTSIVPFPGQEHAQTQQQQPQSQRQKGKESETDDSPLSRASLYVNPPTPMAHPSSIAPSPHIGARPVSAAQLAAMEASAERHREREREREKEREKEREREMERVREWERENVKEKERERERAKERERERLEREREKERERLEKLEREKLERLERERLERLEREKIEREEKERLEREEKERERERERLEKAERERQRFEKEKEAEKERELIKEKEREKAARAARRESRREEKAKREEEKERAARHERRASRHEEQVRADERGSYYEDRPRGEERLSRVEEKPRHEEKDRSSRHIKRESINKDRERDYSSRKDKKERSSTTETFRLVRSPSDNLRHMQGSANAIPVGQEQWTLVEAPPKREKEKDRSSRREKEKEREREKERASPEKSSTRRRESKRDEKLDGVQSSTRSNHRHSSTKEDKHRSSITITHLPLDGTLRHQRSQSLDDRQIVVDQYASERDKERRRARRRESRQAAGHSSDSRSSQTGENALANGNVNSAAPSASVERHGSLRRVVSDLPAGAEQMMSITAREAWDADRVWKGKSMYDPEGGAGNIHGGGSSYDMRNSMYSGHSSIAGIPQGIPPRSVYMTTQSPYYDHGHAPIAHQSSFYAIPVPVGHHPSPPADPYSTQPAFSPGRYAYPHSYRSYPETLDMNSPPPLANPLPEPPRQAAYSPEPLVSNHALQGADDPALTPEYWNVYAGITTH